MTRTQAEALLLSNATPPMGTGRELTCIASLLCVRTQSHDVGVCGVMMTMCVRCRCVCCAQLVDQGRDRNHVLEGRDAWCARVRMLRDQPVAQDGGTIGHGLITHNQSGAGSVGWSIESKPPYHPTLDVRDWMCDRTSVMT
jgi:hypothetical protein